MEEFSEGNLQVKVAQVMTLFENMMKDAEVPTETRIVCLSLLMELIDTIMLSIRTKPFTKFAAPAAIASSIITTVLCKTVAQFSVFFSKGDAEKAKEQICSIFDLVKQKSNELVASEKKLYDEITHSIDEEAKGTSNYKEEVEKLLNRLFKDEGG